MGVSPEDVLNVTIYDKLFEGEQEVSTAFPFPH